jgi:hypothetical protein
MYSGSHLTPLATLLIAVSGTLSLAAYGQSPSPGSDSTSAAASLLPRNVVVPISVVNRFFPEVTQEANTGPNVTAVGNPKATRSVIYANGDNSKKVTITVDQYASSSDASSAYQEAVQKSKIVPGFKPISAPNLGENAFIGTATQGTETHIGLCALKRTLVVEATLAGYELTPDKIANLISLTREEESAAKATLDANAQSQQRWLELGLCLRRGF